MVRYIQFVSSLLVFSALSSNFYKYLFSLPHTTGLAALSWRPQNCTAGLQCPSASGSFTLQIPSAVFQERAPTCKAEVKKLPKHQVNETSCIYFRGIYFKYIILLFTLLEFHTPRGAWLRWCRFSLFRFHKLHAIPTTVAGQHILSILTFSWVSLLATTLKAAVFDRGFSDSLNKFCV